MADTNSGRLIGCPTENDVSLLPFKSALNVNIVIGTGYLIRSIYLFIYPSSGTTAFLTNARQMLLVVHSTCEQQKDASITPNGDTTGGKKNLSKENL